MALRYFLLISLMSTPLVSFSAVSRGAPVPQGNTEKNLVATQATVAEINERISKQTILIGKIRNEINKLENEIAKKNTNFSEVLSQKNKLEGYSLAINEAITKSDLSLQKEKETLKRILKGMVVNSFQEENEAGLLAKKYLYEQLKQNTINVAASLEKVKELKYEMKKTDTELQEWFNNKNSINQVIVDLENKKKDLYSKLSNEADKKQDILKQMVEARKERSAKNHGEIQKIATVNPRISREEPKTLSNEEVKALRGKFSGPLSDFVSYEEKGRGITYKFRENGDVVATGDGKIVYAGELANFGKVVMIDHGDNTRSVILGDFIPKVENGIVVKRGTVVGFTKKKDNQLGKLYFDVRKLDKVQNTFVLLDNKEFVGKSKL